MSAFKYSSIVLDRINLNPFLFHSDGQSDLRDRTHGVRLSEFQVNTKIEDLDCEMIAEHFDNYKDYLLSFGLTTSEKEDVKRKGLSSNKLAIKEVLICWRKRYGSAATFKELLEVLKALKKNEVSENIGRYVKDNIAASKLS